MIASSREIRHADASVSKAGRNCGSLARLSAILAVMVQEDLIAHDFLREHASGGTALFDVLRAIPVADYCARSGLAEDQVREVAQRIAYATGGVSVLEDLGIEMAPHSTLNS